MPTPLLSGLYPVLISPTFSLSPVELCPGEGRALLSTYFSR